MNVQSYDWNVVWKKLPWKKFQKNLYRLQSRIYRNVKLGKLNRAKKLQRFLIRSKSAIFLAVRQVTQLNKGKRTAGIDGQKSLNPQERVKLADALHQKGPKWEHKGLRKINIPKPDGTQRSLHIPTLGDRAYQCLLKYALEPAHEATFLAQSHGFRLGRSVHEALQNIAGCIVSGKTDTWILDGDIEKCFDRINHQYLLNNLICDKTVYRAIQQVLKAGVEPEFTSTQTGTPQGGVISPLLANIALHGIEGKRLYRYKNDRKQICRASIIRYADDFVVICKDLTKMVEIKAEIETKLAERGLRLNERKTRLIKASEGFDFLGHHCQLYPDKVFRMKPSKESITRLLRKVKHIVRKSRHLSWETLISKLNPLLRGWWNFYKFCGNRSLSDSRVRKSLLYIIRKWFLRKRGKTVKDFVQFYKTEGQKLVSTGNCPTEKWIKVQGEKSYFDGDLNYWTKREKPFYNSIYSKKLTQQKFQCCHCGLNLISEVESLELHHVDGNHNNWKLSNLQILHRSCHQQQTIHQERIKQGKRATNTKSRKQGCGQTPIEPECSKLDFLW
jgi:group II intron reverse transcriptase/maturase